MKIRMLPAALALAVALSAAPAVNAAPAAAPAKFKDVLLAYKGKDITISGGRADEAKQRKLVLVGDDYFAVELPDGRRNYFLFVRVGSLQVSDGAVTVYLN